MVEGARVVQAAWSAQGESWQRAALDTWYSAASVRALGPQVVAGDALDLVPPEAAPHVRALIAWQVVEQRLDQEHDLQEWVELTRAARDLRVGEQPGWCREPRSTKPQSSWAQDAGGDEEIPAVLYFATSRRALSADADQDLVLCLLEALARQRPPGTQAILEEAAARSEPLVAWTARRLQERPPPPRYQPGE